MSIHMRFNIIIVVFTSLIFSMISQPARAVDSTEFQFQSRGEEKLVAQEQENVPEKKSKSKIKFSQWDDFLVWLASPQKWNPLLKRLSSLARFIFSGTSIQTQPSNYDTVQ